jgi:hypothetical protein
VPVAGRAHKASIDISSQRSGIRSSRFCNWRRLRASSARESAQKLGLMQGDCPHVLHMAGTEFPHNSRKAGTRSENTSSKLIYQHRRGYVGQQHEPE